MRLPYTSRADVVQAQAARETQLTLHDQTARHQSEVALLQSQVAAAREDVDRAHSAFEEQKARLLDKHQREHADVVAELDSYKEQLKKLHADPLLERERETLQRVTAAFQQAEERIEQKCEARYAQQLADAKAEAEHLRNTTYGRVETLFGSLCGNSGKKGDIGEEFVAMVHSGMQLGTLTSTGRVQCPGYADHAWNYAPPKGPPIRGVVEVKFSQSADSKRDVQKFKDDVREAALTGRANVALYLSLTDRLSCCGKSKMSLEVLHGIPVLWAARDASDDLSAKTLVEMCFTVVAGVWAQISTMERDDANAVLYRIHGFLASQVTEFEKNGGAAQGARQGQRDHPRADGAAARDARPAPRHLVSVSRAAPRADRRASRRAGAGAAHVGHPRLLRLQEALPQGPDRPRRHGQRRPGRLRAGRQGHQGAELPRRRDESRRQAQGGAGRGGRGGVISCTPWRVGIILFFDSTGHFIHALHVRRFRPVRMFEEPLLSPPSAPASRATGWLALACAVFFEVSGTTCMRLALESEWWRLPAYMAYAVSFSLFPWIIREMPMALAYATWSAAGSVCMAAIDVNLFGVSMRPRQWLAIGCITVGVGLLHV